MLYTGLPPERTPVYQILGLVALFVDGFYLPEGGMGAIPSVLARTLAKHGGEIHTDAKVERIELRNEEVAGLKLEGGDSVPLDAVVSTGGGMLSFTALIDAGCLPRSVAQKVRKTPLSHKAVCVQLGLSNRIDAASHSISRLPLMEDQYKVFVPGDGPPEWFNYTVPTVTMPELAPAGGSIIEMFPPIDQSRPIDRWDEEAKESVAQAAIASLSKIHRMDVAVQRVVSPRDYRDTMHLFGGAVYGISPAADPRAQFPHQTPIAGLFLAGQTTYPGYGVGPAMLSGILAAEALMKSARA
jgi:phytoene dehydrogenase-like protein